MNRGRATSGRFLRDARPPPSDARILPLINIVFLLLIFFMLAGRFAFHDPFRITPPRSGSERAAAGRDLLVLVAADGRLGLNGEVMEPAALKSALARRLSRDGAREVHIMADSRGEARQVVAVMQLLRESGAEKLHLLTLSGHR